jgi:hypothetical protein
MINDYPLPSSSRSVRFSCSGVTAGSFHFIEQPQFFRIGFQLYLDFNPLNTFMAVQVFLKPGFQCREQFFLLFGDNSFLLFLMLFIVWTAHVSPSTK